MFVGGGIPDAAVIHAARKKREAARAAGGGDSKDYIPIKKKDDERRGRRGPRLVREEDEDEGEEERVNFTMKEAAKEDEYHSKAAKSDSDSDHEGWEKMQISKAINNQQVRSFRPKSTFCSLFSYSHHRWYLLFS